MSKTILPPNTFITYNLGCRTNQAELEEISKQLTDYGLRLMDNDGLRSTDYRLQQGHVQNLLTQPPTPNLVLINTCMVTQKAERETRKAIRHYRKLYPKAKIVVLGCAVSANAKLGIKLPEADLLIGNEEKDSSVHHIIRLMEGVKRYNMPNDRESYCNKSDTDYTGYFGSGRKLIKIQDGCSNYCSFCITTYLRGEPRSEEPEKIIGLIDEWINRGIKEIILTGINIGLYGIDLQPQTSIWGLVDRIMKETKIERLTLSTVYPEMLYGVRTVLCARTVLYYRTVLYDTINNPRLTRCFHLALQSGSPTVLQRMNRPTNLKKLLQIIKEIRKVQLDFTFRADVIAGFPNESEEEHQETLKFIQQAKISFAHVFPYSSRVGTVAYQMIQKKRWREVPVEIKKRRAGEIRQLVDQLNGELGKKMIGKTYRVLVIRELDEKLEGISENGWTVKINQKLKINLPAGKAGNHNDNKKIKNIAKGQFVEVKITGYEKGQVLGEIVHPFIPS